MYQVISPELVTIWLSSRKRQHERYPLWPDSSRLTRTLPSRVLRLQIEQMLSRPPHATKFPDGAQAHVITQLERKGIACICEQYQLDVTACMKTSPHRVYWQYHPLLIDTIIYLVNFCLISNEFNCSHKCMIMS